MKRNLIIDGHCDTLTKAFDSNLLLNNSSLMFNLKIAKKKRPCIQFLATFMETELPDPYAKTKRILEHFEKEYTVMQEKYPITKITQYADAKQVLQEEGIGLVLTTENGIVIGDKVEHIDQLYAHGVRVMGIVWNEDNALGSGAHTKKDKGLTPFGTECVKRMQQLGIIVDVSHASYHTFMDILALTDNVIATHSCVNTICPHVRNLNDEQIKLMASKNGVIGICFYSDFLSSKGNATVEDIVEHICYIKELVGIDYVGIGSDFDGMNFNKTPIDLQSMGQIDHLAKKMKQKGFCKEEISKVLGLNLLRILKRI